MIEPLQMKMKFQLACIHVYQCNATFSNYQTNEFKILPNHYVHLVYHEMRTHHCRSVHFCFAMGSVVCLIALQLSVFSSR